MERRVELFAAIRFDWQRYRMPVRALARKYDVHRRTVRQAIASPVPPDRKVPERAAPVREAVAGWIDEMLREDLAVRLSCARGRSATCAGAADQRRTAPGGHNATRALPRPTHRPGAATRWLPSTSELWRGAALGFFTPLVPRHPVHGPA